LKFLIKQRPNSRLTIIWDGASYHKSQELRDYLDLVNKGKTPEEWKINCILFAPNAPEQNPVEDIWLQGKNLMRKSHIAVNLLQSSRDYLCFFLIVKYLPFQKIICMGSVHNSFRIAIRPILGLNRAVTLSEKGFSLTGLSVAQTQSQPEKRQINL
jgi:transposase